jgi:hypothetical protein
MSEMPFIQKTGLTIVCLGFLLFAQEQQDLDIQDDSTGSQRQEALAIAMKDTSARKAEVAYSDTVKGLARGQEHKVIIGFGGGISPASWLYIGDPVGLWGHKNTSMIVQVFYARQVLEAVRLGSYFEFENATCYFNYYNNGDEFYKVTGNALRFNWGLNWLAQYPRTAFHAQLGGYAGFGFVSSLTLNQNLNGSSTQNLPGVDLGIMVGPAYETKDLGIALHLQAGYGFYHLSSGSPDEVSFALIPRILLKIYHKI